VLPVVLAVALILFIQGWRRGAAIWLGVIGATFGVILVLKLGFMACEPVFGPWSLRTPSGHTAAASVVAGGFATVLGGGTLVTMVVAVLAAVTIGTSRVELGFHSLPEVLLGAVTGIAGAAILARLVGRPPLTRPVPLLAVALGVAVLVHGFHLPAETAISHLARGMLDFVPACREPPGAS
jgi:membrane-associated phospholipid phosphatase